MPEHGSSPRDHAVILRKGSQNLLTPHGPEHYPGVRVVRPTPHWDWVIVPADGQSFTALGGEWACGYTTPAGGRADAIQLRAGDRATRIRAGLEFHLAEWRIERTTVP